jgi:hypothetical protein
VHDPVELHDDHVVFAPLGGRRLRRVGAGVLIAGGAVQLVAGAIARSLPLVLAGLVAMAFGVSVLRSARRGTTVTADGWHDPTRVRNQHLAWSELAAVRVTPNGEDAVVSLERRGEGIGAAVRVARLPLAQVPETLAVVAPWATDAGVDIRDRTAG